MPWNGPLAQDLHKFVTIRPFFRRFYQLNRAWRQLQFLLEKLSWRGSANRNKINSNEQNDTKSENSCGKKFTDLIPYFTAAAPLHFYTNLNLKSQILPPRVYCCTCRRGSWMGQCPPDQNLSLLSKSTCLPSLGILFLYIYLTITQNDNVSTPPHSNVSHSR